MTQMPLRDCRALQQIKVAMLAEGSCFAAKEINMKIIGYILVIIGTLIGGYELLNTLAYAESAPQQAAGAAMAIAWATLPYCFARAVEKIGEVTMEEAMERHQKWLEDRSAQRAAASQPRFDPQTGQPLASGSSLARKFDDQERKLRGGAA